MKSGLRAYFDLIYQQHDCYATWLPGTSVAVGDIGNLSGSGSFLRTGSLSSRATMLPVRDIDEPAETISTESGIKFSAGADIKTDEVIEVLAGGSANVTVTFGRANSAAMVLRDVVRHEFDDEWPVRQLMIELLAAGRLAQEEIVVTQVIEAGSGVILTAYNAAKGADVKLGGKLGQATITIANVGGLLKIVQGQNSQTTATAELGRPLTPMYRALVFKRHRKWPKFWSTYLKPKPGIAVQRRLGGQEADDEILADIPSVMVAESRAANRPSRTSRTRS